jgi:hypothetical protein
MQVGLHVCFREFELHCGTLPFLAPSSARPIVTQVHQAGLSRNSVIEVPRSERLLRAQSGSLSRSLSVSVVKLGLRATGARSCSAYRR